MSVKEWRWCSAWEKTWSVRDRECKECTMQLGFSILGGWWARGIFGLTHSYKGIYAILCHIYLGSVRFSSALKFRIENWTEPISFLFRFFLFDFFGYQFFWFGFDFLVGLVWVWTPLKKNINQSFVFGK